MKILPTIVFKLFLNAFRKSRATSSKQASAGSSAQAIPAGVALRYNPNDYTEQSPFYFKFQLCKFLRNCSKSTYSSLLCLKLIERI